MTARPEIDATAVALQSSRDGATGKQWVHLLPAGTFHGRDGRGPYQAENPAAIMQTSRQLAGRNQIPVDYNHAIDRQAPKGEPSPAAGWIVGLQARRDGIWGEVEWTPRARQHLAEREYRYLSPAFAHTRDGRVTAILRASLVNNPNLEQLVALASAETPAMSTPLDTALTELRAALDLSEDADMAAILAAIGELKTQRMSEGKPDPAQYVPIGDYTRLAQELRRVHQGVELHAARDHVEEAFRKGYLLGFQKDWAIQLCTANKPAFDKYCRETGELLASALMGATVRGKPPGSGSHDFDPSGTDAHVASVLGHTPEALNKSTGK